MENTAFSYQYSAAQSKEIESIRKKYLPHEEDKMQVLRKLDLQAQTAGMVESLSVGIIGSLVFGIGMCFGLDVFGGADWLSLLFGGLGALIMAPAYPLYRRISAKKRERLAPEILRLSDEIIESGK
jgi:hypothetical protein